MIGDAITQERIQEREIELRREIARKLEEKHERLWMIIFGVCTWQFVCFPLFAVPDGTMVLALYPGAADERMTAIERICGMRRGAHDEDKGGEQVGG